LEDGSYTTPFELAHNSKPDLCNLFKLFALAAVRHEHVNSENLGKFDSQSLPMIAVGKCPNSNGLLFYNPVNQTFVSSIDYQFQNHVTSGTRFNLRYQSGTFIYRLDESTTIYAPKFKLDSKVLVHTHSPPHVATVIGLPTYHRPNIYTVSYPDGSITEYSDTDNILDALPDSVEISSCPILPSWIKGGATATLFLPEISKPRHGTLLCDTGQNWFFCPGAIKDSSKFIPLPDLVATCQALLDNANLFRGYAKFKRVYQARFQVQLKTCVLRHVSAHGLTSLLAPSSLKQISKLNSPDQSIWQAAYDLSSLPTWEVLTEEHFRQMSKGLKPLPTMAIATIKYDEHNRPKRAKYRLVVLGNDDPHCWSKEATAAPVMSQLELRILTSLAVFNRRVLKNCDIKQAFVQSSLPSNEQYFLRPPVGCPRSSPGTYWRLIRSLYGLRLAPRLWFEKLCSHLQGMGLKNSVISPCLFVGHLIEGAPLIYVGIYVDDIIYFSASNDVERTFEGLLLTIDDVDFMGQVSHFLGIEFTWKHHSDGHLSVCLTQQSFIETLLDSLGLLQASTSHYTTPYHSGIVIDSIPHQDMSSEERDKLRLTYQSIVGSLNWLAHTTRPDLSTVVSLLAQHQQNPSYGHLEAAHYAAKYLAGTKTLGIYFTSAKRHTMEAFLHFPLSPKILAMSDANWGPQDASRTVSNTPLPLFVSRSMSAFFIDLFGPLHWVSKRQAITAVSSAEAEIYATSECVRFLLELVQIFEFLGVRDIFMPGMNVIFNDNQACVNWSHSCTSKGLRHIQMKENHVRENIVSDFVSIQHIEGKLNLADIFTKEMKDVSHFVKLRDVIMCHHFLF